MIINPKKRQKFIQKWNKELIQKLSKNHQEFKIFELKSDNFKKNVAIEFEDGSIANYRYAFFVENKDEYAIFTEHCGYYEFQKNEIKEIQEHDTWKVKLKFYKN